MSGSPAHRRAPDGGRQITPRSARLWELLRARGPMTMDALVAATGEVRFALTETLQRLAARGLVRHDAARDLWSAA